MTTINALKFDEYSGICICDEQRGWNPENMRIMSSDKIRPVVPQYIQQEFGLSAAYGNTGSSSIGDEIKYKLARLIDQEYQRRLNLNKKKKLEEFMTVREIAEMAYQLMIDIKHQNVSDEILSKFGFTEEEFIQGFYVREGEKYEIKEKDVIEKVYQHMTWEKRGKESMPVFLNAAIVAGYDEKEGFSIYHLSQIEQFSRSVDKFFVTDGSGRDPTNLVFSEYLETLPATGRNSIDRVEGLFTAIAAVQYACRRSIGVGGYAHIKYIDGRQKDRSKMMIDIEDSRAKLASELVAAGKSGLISHDHVLEMLDNLVYKNKSTKSVNEMMWKKTKDVKKLHRLLRGYKI
ncbi:hypothetical protein KAJ27_16920 [bacterium]|nr:hypothetical protein [bacterium]